MLTLDVGLEAEQAVNAAGGWGVAGGLVVVLVTLLASVVVAEALRLVLKRVGRRSAVVAEFARRARVPLLGVVVSWALRQALVVYEGAGTWGPGLDLVLRLGLIAFLGWLLGALAFAAEAMTLKRYDVSVTDNRRARRARTQVILVRRLVTGALVLLTAAVMLLQFDGARAVGTSMLASAGLVSVVAGLAAQSTLANVFAGLQLAFTDALRVDDVVVIDDEWGRIEDITLTYVVVHVWDDRRLVVPSTRFTTETFQNWTRTEAAVLGSVEMDLDWSTPTRAMRDELDAVLAGHDLWDGRVGVLQVTDAVGSFVRVRVLLSAKDGPTLFDLRCDVRERLVEWLREEHADALPQVRTSVAEKSPRVRSRSQKPVESGDERARVFSGNPEAERRANDFTGSVPRLELDAEGRAVGPSEAPR